MTETAQAPVASDDEFAGHTPGPWRIGPSHDDEYLGPPGEIAIIGSDNTCAAVAIPTGNKGDQTPVRTATNARLIAAAPLLFAERNTLRAQRDELLAALREIAELKGLTLIAPSKGVDYDVGHQIGAQKAFNQAAEIALDAIAKCEAAP